MFISMMPPGEIDQVVDLYNNVEINRTAQIAFEDFEQRCRASVAKEVSVIKLSDWFCAREVTFQPRVYSFLKTPKGNEDDHFVGCATVFDDNLEGFTQQDSLIIIDICFFWDVYKNTAHRTDYASEYMREFINTLLREENKHNYINACFYAEDDEFVAFMDVILRRNLFERSDKTTETLAFIDPPDGDPLPEGTQRKIRPIARYVLDRSRAIARGTGELREFFPDRP